MKFFSHSTRMGKLIKRSEKAFSVFHRLLAKLEKHNASLRKLMSEVDDEIFHLNQVKNNAMVQHSQNETVANNVKTVLGVSSNSTPQN